MKLIYLFTSPSLNGSSVQTKVLNQIKYLNKAGSECRGAFFSTEVTEVTPFNENVDFIPVEKCTWKYFRMIGQRIILDKAVSRFLSQQYNHTDIFYLRYPGASKELYYTVKEYGDKMVTEHQSKELDEIKTQSKSNSFGLKPSLFLSWLQHSKIALYNEKVYGPKIRRLIKVTVSVTSEIAEYQKSLGSRKSIVIANGINVSNYKIRNTASLNELSKIRILYLKGGSTDVPWSGLERLIHSIEKDPSNEGLFELVIAGKPEQKYNSYSFINQIGYVREPELTALIEHIHIGINHLGLHKIGLSESSNLKVREYFSRGLPFINGSIDQDITGNEFVLQIANNDELVDMKLVLEFAQKILTDPEHPQKMRKHAEAHLDYEVKMHDLSVNLKSI